MMRWIDGCGSRSNHFRSSVMGEQHLFHHPLVDQWVGSDCE